MKGAMGNGLQAGINFSDERDIRKKIDLERDFKALEKQLGILKFSQISFKKRKNGVVAKQKEEIQSLGKDETHEYRKRNKN